MMASSFCCRGSEAPEMSNDKASACDAGGELRKATEIDSSGLRFVAMSDDVY